MGRRDMFRNIHKGRWCTVPTATLQFSGQVEDVSPTFGEQTNQIAAFEPDMEEIELELDEEDFAPPPATNYHKENLSGGSDWSFGEISSSSKFQADMGALEAESVQVLPWYWAIQSGCDLAVGKWSKEYE